MLNPDYCSRRALCARAKNRIHRFVLTCRETLRIPRMLRCMPQISVVVPSKNRPVDVIRCVDSLLAQGTCIGEIIVVDQSAVPYELPADSRIVHMHSPELSGLTAARNAGVARA